MKLPRPGTLEFEALCHKLANGADYKKEASNYGITEDYLRHRIPRGKYESFIIDPMLDVVLFDLETSNLRADFSVILCACLQVPGKDPVVFRNDVVNSNWTTERKDDYEITKAIRDELVKHTIIVTHNGTKFDIPYLKAKLIKHHLPALPPMLHIDTLMVARKCMFISSRRLENLGNWIFGQGKSRVDGDIWMEAAYDGSKEAMDHIVEHNIVDCELLGMLCQRLQPYIRQIQRI